MNSLIKKIVVCGSCVVTLTACVQPKQKKLIEITASQKMDSNQLANAGEQLMMPHTLNLAYRVFEMALSKNPDNKKAQFYSAFLKRFMVFEGVLTRVQPYVDQYGEPEQFQQMIDNMPNHPAKDFLLGVGGKQLAPIANLADFQNLLIEYRKAVENFREFIAKNADMNLELYLNPYLFEKRINENLNESCEVKDESPENVTVVCDYQNMGTVKVNMADLIAMKQFAAGEILYLTLYTSYGVGNIDTFLEESRDKKLTAKAVFEKIETISGTGVLLKDQSMTKVKDLGADFGVALKWAIKYQDSLCKQDSHGRTVPRRGFLIKNICVDTDNASKSLVILERALAGTMKVKIPATRETPEIEKNMNFVTLFTNPLRDLRRVFPETWNKNGTAATSLRDRSAGGLFPDGDVNDLLKYNEKN